MLFINKLLKRKSGKVNKTSIVSVPAAKNTKGRAGGAMMEGMAWVWVR